MDDALWNERLRKRRRYLFWRSKAIDYIGQRDANFC